jgi:DNA-binding winged helix-turn-helix (wHTH) protein
MQETRTSFIFLPYRLDPDERNLRRDADFVSLTPKEFDTLLALVEAGGRVVEKEELIQRVWPDSYVGDGSLARNISVLRKALGEEVIETLPKKGYRITLPITRVEVARQAPMAKSRLEPEPLPGAIPSSVTSTLAVSRWKQRIVIWPLLAAVILLVVAFRFAGIRSARARPVPESIPPVRSVLIHKEGAIDPLDEGFQLHAPDGQYPKVLYNRETNGWDRWRIKSNDQNYFYRGLNAAEKDFALARNWKTSCVCALEAGAGFAAIDFAGKGPRFDMEFFREGNRYFVGLTRQITPTLEWDQKIESAGIADVAHPHTYELRYDHATQTASLWIDGQKRADGYRGYHQFQEDRGLFFGAEIYGQSTEGSFVFRSVSFEAQ